MSLGSRSRNADQRRPKRGAWSLSAASHRSGDPSLTRTSRNQTGRQMWRERPRLPQTDSSVCSPPRARHPVQATDCPSVRQRLDESRRGKPGGSRHVAARGSDPSATDPSATDPSATDPSATDPSAKIFRHYWQEFDYAGTDGRGSESGSRVWGANVRACRSRPPRPPRSCAQRPGRPCRWRPCQPRETSLRKTDRESRAPAKGSRSVCPGKRRP